MQLSFVMTGLFAALTATMGVESGPPARPPVAGQIHLVLRSNVTVFDEYVTGRDLFENSPPAFVAGMKLFQSPRFGGEIRLTDRDVLRKLLSTAPCHYELAGAGTVRIDRFGRDRRTEVEQFVRRAVEQHYRGRANTECQVSFPETPLFLPEGPLNVDLTLPARETGLDILHCQVRVNNRVIRKMNIACRVIRREIVPVAAQPLARGDTLRTGDIEWVEQTVDRHQRPAFRKGDRPEDYRLKRSIQPGRIIYQDAVDKHPDIFRGQVVDLVVQKEMVRVTAKATACEDGWIGSLIRVKNLINNDYLHARVVGKGVVVYE
jgi:flagella basal body P-ring formation protein FlgA